MHLVSFDITQCSLTHKLTYLLLSPFFSVSLFAVSFYPSIMCEVEGRLASAVLAAHLSPTAVPQACRLHQLHCFKSAPLFLLLDLMLLMFSLAICHFISQRLNRCCNCINYTL